MLITSPSPSLEVLRCRCKQVALCMVTEVTPLPLPWLPPCDDVACCLLLAGCWGEPSGLKMLRWGYHLPSHLSHFAVQKEGDGKMSAWHQIGQSQGNQNLSVPCSWLSEIINISMWVSLWPHHLFTASLWILSIFSALHWITDNLLSYTDHIQFIWELSVQ